MVENRSGAVTGWPADDWCEWEPDWQATAKEAQRKTTIGHRRMLTTHICEFAQIIKHV